jgi:hypothetical protein
MERMMEKRAAKSGSKKVAISLIVKRQPKKIQYPDDV